jgi:hypothetical protein
MFTHINFLGEQITVAHTSFKLEIYRGLKINVGSRKSHVHTYRDNVVYLLTEVYCIYRLCNLSP